jgi:hypothetical protein
MTSARIAAIRSIEQTEATGKACSVPIPLEVSVLPAASVARTSGRGNALRYDVGVKSKVPRTTSAAYTLEVLDPQYRVVSGTTKNAAAQSLNANAERKSSEMTPDLADGFYIARVTGAISDGMVVHRNGVYSYFQVQGGSSVPLSLDEFNAQAGNPSL